MRFHFHGSDSDLLRPNNSVDAVQVGDLEIRIQSSIVKWWKGITGDQMEEAASCVSYIHPILLRIRALSPSRALIPLMSSLQ